MKVDGESIEERNFFVFGTDNFLHEGKSGFVTMSSSKGSLEMGSHPSSISNVKLLCILYKK